MGGSNAKDFFGRSILVRSLVSVSWREHMIRFGELTWGKKIVNISQKLRGRSHNDPVSVSLYCPELPWVSGVAGTALSYFYPMNMRSPRDLRSKAIATKSNR